MVNNRLSEDLKNKIRKLLDEVYIDCASGCETYAETIDHINGAIGNLLIAEETKNNIDTSNAIRELLSIGESLLKAWSEKYSDLRHEIFEYYYAPNDREEGTDESL